MNLQKKDFDLKQNEVLNSLRNLLKDNINFKLQETEMTTALGCLGAGIKFLNLVASGYN